MLAALWRLVFERSCLLWFLFLRFFFFLFFFTQAVDTAFSVAALKVHFFFLCAV